MNVRAASTRHDEGGIRSQIRGLATWICAQQDPLGLRVGSLFRTWVYGMGTDSNILREALG